MDTIQQVDCFERLYQHLLACEPDFQTRVSAESLPTCRTQNLLSLKTRLVAISTGQDLRTAESLRRIRRLIHELERDLSDESVAPAIEPQKPPDSPSPSDRPLSEARKKHLRTALANLTALGPDASSAGIDLDARLQALENLPARFDWVRRTLPCLSGLGVFRYLNAIGHPVAVPDRRCQTFLFRLGLLPETGERKEQWFAACGTVEEIARLLQRSPLEMNGWIQAFTGGMADVSPQTALCRDTPRCEACELCTYCQFFRFQAPRRDDDSPLSVKQWRPSERPRERLARHGAPALEDAELLAIILRTGTGKVNVLELARRLLDRFGNLQGLEDASLEELQEVRGIGQMKAIELKAVIELGRRQAMGQLLPGEVLDGSDKVFQVYQGRFRRLMQEEFVLLMLNNKGRVIREEVISRGGLDSSIVHPREVFKAAIRASAASVIFIHNHPSGDPTPSHDDFLVTRRLEEAAELLKIRVLDHLIIGADSYYSFTDGQTMTLPNSTPSQGAP